MLAAVSVPISRGSAPIWRRPGAAVGTPSLTRLMWNGLGGSPADFPGLIIRAAMANVPDDSAEKSLYQTSSLRSNSK
jgi:hypothetical protein